PTPAKNLSRSWSAGDASLALAIRPGAPIRVTLLRRHPVPSARNHPRVENPAKPSVCHGDNARLVRSVTLEPIHRVAGSTHELMVSLVEQTIAPLRMTHHVPYLDGKANRDPTRRLEPNLA